MYLITVSTSRLSAYRSPRADLRPAGEDAVDVGADAVAGDGARDTGHQQGVVVGVEVADRGHHGQGDRLTSLSVMNYAAEDSDLRVGTKVDLLSWRVARAPSGGGPGRCPSRRGRRSGRRRGLCTGSTRRSSRSASW
jgi:hypothetical protein